MVVKIFTSSSVCSRNFSSTLLGSSSPPSSSSDFLDFDFVILYRWVNRKDEGGNNVFEGGFLGLDNISPFNRSEKLPTGGTMRQADGTGWMGFYCLSM